MKNLLLTTTVAITITATTAEARGGFGFGFGGFAMPHMMMPFNAPRALPPQGFQGGARPFWGRPPPYSNYYSHMGSPLQQSAVTPTTTNRANTAATASDPPVNCPVGTSCPITYGSFGTTTLNGVAYANPNPIYNLGQGEPGTPPGAFPAAPTAAAPALAAPAQVAAPRVAAPTTTTATSWQHPSNFKVYGSRDYKSGAKIPHEQRQVSAGPPPHPAPAPPAPVPQAQARKVNTKSVHLQAPTPDDSSGLFDNHPSLYQGFRPPPILPNDSPPEEETQ